MNRKSLSETIRDEEIIRKNFTKKSPTIKSDVFKDNVLYKINDVTAVKCPYFEEANLVQSLNALCHDNFPYIYLPPLENFLLKEYVYSYDLKEYLEYLDRFSNIKTHFFEQIGIQLSFMIEFLWWNKLISSYDNLRIYFHNPKFISYLLNDKEIILGPFNCTVLDYSTFQKSSNDVTDYKQIRSQVGKIMGKYTPIFKYEYSEGGDDVKRKISIPIPDNLDITSAIDCFNFIKNTYGEETKTYDLQIYIAKVMSKFSKGIFDTEIINSHIQQAKDLPRAEYVQYLTEEIDEFVTNSIVIGEDNKVYDVMEGNVVGEASIFIDNDKGDREKNLLKITDCNGREYGVLKYFIDNTETRFGFYPCIEERMACKKLNMRYSVNTAQFYSQGKFFGYKIKGYSFRETIELENYFFSKGIMPFDPEKAPYPEFDLTTGGNGKLPICRMCDSLKFDKDKMFVFGIEKSFSQDIIFGVVKGYFFIYPRQYSDSLTVFEQFLYSEFSPLDCDVGFLYVTVDVYKNGQISNIRPCKNKTIEMLKIPLELYFNIGFNPVKGRFLSIITYVLNMGLHPDQKMRKIPYINKDAEYEYYDDKGKKKLLNRAEGCLLGAEVGDALGATYKSQKRSSIGILVGKLDIKGGGPLEVKPGQVTDCTEMILGLAISLIHNEMTIQNIAKTYVEWMTKSEPFENREIIRAALDHENLSWEEKDMEKSTIKIMEIVNKENINSLSNGSLMRAIPLAIYTHNMSNSRWQIFTIYETQLTHGNVEVILSTCLYIQAIHLLLDFSEPKYVFKYIKDYTKNFPEYLFPEKKKDEVKKAKERILKILEYAEKKEELKFGNGKVVKFDAPAERSYYGIPFYLAFRYLLEDYTYEQSMVRVIEMGGDTNTNATIVGGLIGAKYGFSGIPKRWVNAVLTCENPRSIKDKIVPDNAPKSQRGYYPFAKQADLKILAEELLRRAPIIY